MNAAFRAGKRRGPSGGGGSGLHHPLLVVALLLGTAAQPAFGAAAPSGASIVATARASSVAVFRTPTATRPFRIVRQSASRSPLVFLVRQRRAGWEQLWLPVRPNESVGWVRTQSVSLALDAYRVTVSLRLHRITVWKQNRVILRAAAAVGRPTDPTPTGTFYVTELLAQPNPNGLYGPYAFGLSAYSNVLYSFGGGPGQIGIHGTNEPGLLGTSASHGCVRIANTVIVRLAQLLPLGTSVVISD